MRIGHRQDPSRGAIPPIRVIKPAIGTGASTGNVRIKRLPLFASDAKHWEPSFLARNPHSKASEKSRMLKFGGVCYDVLSLTDHLA
jgi:hypothetical protein